MGWKYGNEITLETSAPSPNGHIMSEEIYQKLAQVVIDGDIENAETLAKEVVEQGLDARICINTGLIKGIQRAWDLFASGEFELPELINSIDSMEAALCVLESVLVGEQNREIISLLLVRKIEGDQNENGKFLLGTMLIDEDLTDSQKLPNLKWLT